MLNSLAIYEDSGRRAGKARKQGDEGLADHEKRWALDAKRLEQKEDWPAVEDAWQRGYREGRGEIKFIYE